MGITTNQFNQLQDNVTRHKKLSIDGLFPEINAENKVLMNPDKYNEMIMLLRIRYKEKKAIFINGNVPSLKSSQEIRQLNTGKSACCNAPYIKVGSKEYICTKCDNRCQLGKRAILGHSDRVQEYIDNNSQQFIDNRPLYLELIKNYEKPIYVGMYFIRASKHRWDFHNAVQLLADLMTKHNLNSDDDVNNFIPVYLGSHHDPIKPGVIIYILDSKKYDDYLLSLI